MRLRITFKQGIMGRCEGSGDGRACAAGRGGGARWASFAPSRGAKPTRCGSCRGDAWVNVRAAECEGEGEGRPCTRGEGGGPRLPSFAPPGEAKPRRCLGCKGDGWVNVRRER